MGKVLKGSIAVKIAAMTQVEARLRVITAKIILANLESLQARVAAAQTIEDVRDILAFEVEVAKETIKVLLAHRAA